MVEIAAKRIEVRRERVGLQEEGLRGVNDSPANVAEALETVCAKLKADRKSITTGRKTPTKLDAASPASTATPGQSKQQRIQVIKEAQEGRKTLQGR